MNNTMSFKDRKEPELELLENLFKQKDADEWIRDISEIFDDLIDVRYNKNDTNLSSLVCIRRLQQFFMDMKEKGYDKTEYEQELAKFKKEYESLQEKLNQIQPPPANKNFALLDDEIKNKSKQIEDMINSNAIQKQAIINDWENAIEQENSRHKQKKE